MYYYKGDNMKAVVKTEVGFDNMVLKKWKNQRQKEI